MIPMTVAAEFAVALLPTWKTRKTSGFAFLSIERHCGTTKGGFARVNAISNPEGGGRSMMDSAIVFTYTRAAPGREKEALDAFTEGMAFFGTASHDGKCGDPINVMETTGRSLIIVPGEYGALSELIRSEEFRELYTKTVFAVPDIGYQLGAFGQGVQEYMARWARVGTEMSLL